MKFEDLLPIGSVVRLKDGKKNVMVIGLMQSKHTEGKGLVLYDYLGVPYPEGYMGKAAGVLFYHNDIQETVFMGYAGKEREAFVAAVQKIVEKTEAHIKARE